MKMMRAILFFTVTFCVQPAVMLLFNVKSYAPNLLLCVTLLLILTETETGPVIGIAVLFAALQDLCFSVYPGPASAAIFAAGVTAALAGRVFTSDSLVFLTALTILETLVYNLVLWAGGRILGAPYDFLYVLSLQAFYILCNLALMLIFYFLILKKREGGYRV